MNIYISGSLSFKDWLKQLLENELQESRLLADLGPLCVVSDSELADCVIAETLAQKGASDGNATQLPLPTIWVADEVPPADFAQRAEDLVFVRGPGLSTMLPQLLRVAWQRRQIDTLHEVQSGPFTHDVRGALSVVALCRQLLEAGGQGPLVIDKLKRAGERVSVAFVDIDARLACITGALPKNPNEFVLDGAAGLGGCDLSTWFAKVRPDRTLEIDEGADAVIRQTSDYVCLVLTGMLDGLARLADGDLCIRRLGDAKEAPPSLLLVAKRPRLSATQGSALSETSRWSVLSPTIIPYRLATSGMLVLDAGGSLAWETKKEQLELTLGLPSDIKVRAG